MEKVKVNIKKTEDRSYEILIGEEILKRVPLDLGEEKLAYSYVIITDSVVSSLYGRRLLRDLKTAGLKAYLISFPAGEEYKSRKTKSRIEDKMSKLKIGRDSAVIALGGGVVGDIAGFVAATYNRGIPYIQIPTTLVASVDSSIGGKTGVDTQFGKNLIGAFYQPRRVYIDVKTLRTLPKKEIRGGLAEVIKYGVIKDKEFFEFLEENIESVFSFVADILIHIIKRSCEIKGNIVELDEKESNLRKILNFGHTIGHAIENLYDYKIPHGEAISIGMVAEGKIAMELGLWQRDEIERLTSLLSRSGLPTKLPDSIDLDRMVDIMRLDKKARGGKIEMTLPRRIGEMAEIGGNYGIRVEEKLIFRIVDLD